MIPTHQLTLTSDATGVHYEVTPMLDFPTPKRPAAHSRAAVEAGFSRGSLPMTVLPRGLNLAHVDGGLENISGRLPA